jgi:hypothetical protein
MPHLYLCGGHLIRSNYIVVVCHKIMSRPHISINFIYQILLSLAKWMGLDRRCKQYSRMVTPILAISGIDSVNINKIIYSMYKNDISDRRGSYMHTIRGKVAVQQDKK